MIQIALVASPPKNVIQMAAVAFPQAQTNLTTDITYHLANGLEMGDTDNATLKLLPPGSSPDYMTHPDAWYAEHAYIAKQFQNNPTAQISPEPAPTPW